MGDFPRVARETIAPTGPLLAEACGIGPGMRVLDVAAGAGNVALAAARAGAEVVASDITPELLDAGSAVAEREGLRLDWVVADAQSLPFDDGSFDVVTSSFGAMFAPDHATTARELLRVCRSGGTIGMVNWTPEGWSGRFFALLAPAMPPEAVGPQPPVLWGDEAHVRELLGPGCASLTLERRVVVLDRFADAESLIAFYRQHFGPVIAAFGEVAGDDRRTGALAEALLEFARSSDLAAPGEPPRWELEYLLVVGTRG